MKYNFNVQLTNQSRLSEVDFNNIPFGRIFSDHMFVADYDGKEWTDLRIVPYGNLEISPASAVLHYSQTIFEGMKATKGEDGTPLLFRPEMNAHRLNKSAVRMAMPQIPEELFLQALDELIAIDHHWIPTVEDSSLYIRPYMFANDPFVGVRPSDTYRFIIFTAPVGAYYSNAVKLLVSEKYIRAAVGGTGAAKTGGNYAATLLPMLEAQKQGFDQLMWLDANEFKYIQECGTMNLFFIVDGKVLTPTVETDTILYGITRDSFITMLRSYGLEVEERLISIDEIVEAHKAGKLEDAFGAGTAAVVTAVESFNYRDENYVLPALETRKYSIQLKEDLANLRKGTLEDKFNWMHKVEVLEMV
jgi:branched-chain amino acid aminotransferase